MQTAPIYYEVVEATWPAHRSWREGCFTYRDGQGGGSRVSATTFEGGEQASPTPAQIRTAEAQMASLGQPCLFMVRDGQGGLDHALENAGYQVKDPVTLWRISPGDLIGAPLPRVATFCIWEPLAIQRELWAEGGIGPERLAIMQRAKGVKTAILGRIEDKPAGVAFVAIERGRAMLHALEIRASMRRKGMAQLIMRQAAFWAAEQNAEELCLLCTRENNAANQLYDGLGFAPGGGYHYRIKG